MNKEDRKAALEATYKSKDTEEWLDKKFNRPIGYWWAIQFNLLNIHPNVVTIISIIVGVFSAYCFYFDSSGWTWLGILMLTIANTLDSADGQLARMTNKKTLLGRVLDGFAGDIWFFAIYFSIGLRLTPEPMPFFDNEPWGIWIWILMFFAGLFSHLKQCRLADYYRNIYMYFNQEKSELTDSVELQEQQRNTSWDDWFKKIWLFFYRNYTKGQEHSTPAFQRLKGYINEKYGNNMPQYVRRDFCKHTFPLLKWTNILTFNTRVIVLYLSMLFGQPWIYLIFELTILNIIYLYMKRTHETICLDVIKLIINE